MKCNDIIEVLCKLAPEEYACSWDNVGLLCGRRGKDVKKILVTIDVTNEVVEMAINKKVDMIVSHHPMIFRAIKTINDDDFISKRIIKLISNDISYYAMHTNFDMVENGMGKLAADKLELKNMSFMEIEKEVLDIKLPSLDKIKSGIEKIYDNGIKKEDIKETLDKSFNNKLRNKVGTGIIGYLPEKISLEKLCNKIKKEFNIETLAVYGNIDKDIEKIAICPGSGEDYIRIALENHVDAYITGDIKHHVGLDAAEQGLTIIDGTHFGLEHIFIEHIKEYLEKNIINTGDLEIIPFNAKSPITYF